MLTAQQFSVLATALKAAYPDQRFMASEEAFNTWYQMLKDIPYEQLSEAVKAYIQSEPYTPTISGIRGKVKALEPMGMNALEAWGMVRDALTRSGYYYQDEYDKLPIEIQKAVGCAENLQNWSQLDTQELDTVIQSQFIRSYGVVQKRMEERDMMSYELAEKTLIMMRENRKRLADQPSAPKQIERASFTPELEDKLAATYKILGGYSRIGEDNVQS